MSAFSGLKDVLFTQATKLASNPKVTKLATDPRLMNAAMKALSMGGAVKSNIDSAGKMGAGMLGLATQDEIDALKETVQSLETQLRNVKAEQAAAQQATPVAHDGGASTGEG